MGPNMCRALAAVPDTGWVLSREIAEASGMSNHEARAALPALIARGGLVRRLVVRPVMHGSVVYEYSRPLGD